MISENGHKPRAVLFDLDGTLRFNDPSDFDAYFQYAADLGITADAEARRAMERWAHCYWADAALILSDFKSSKDEGWQVAGHRYLAVLTGADPYSPPNGRLAEAALAIHLRFQSDYKPASRLAPDALPALARLRAAGYVLGLVSNRTEPLDAIAAEHGLAGAFDFSLSAGQAGTWKPDPRIFLQAAEMAGVAPAQAAYVGDNYYADVVGARDAGLTPILIDPHGLFPEPECRAIRTLAELGEWLG